MLIYKAKLILQLWLRALRNGQIILDYLGGTNIITWALKSRRGRQKIWPEKWDNRRGSRDSKHDKDLTQHAGFEDGRRGLQAKECEQFLETENSPQPPTSRKMGTLLPQSQETEFWQQLKWARKSNLPKKECNLDDTWILVWWNLSILLQQP